MGMIKGIVRSSSNRPLADVNLLIVVGPSHSDIVAVTGEDGTFEFTNLRAGHYILKAYGHVESDEIPVQLLARQVPFVEIWLDMLASPNYGENVVDEENYFSDGSYFSEDGKL